MNSAGMCPSCGSRLLQAEGRKRRERGKLFNVRDVLYLLLIAGAPLVLLLAFGLVFKPLGVATGGLCVFVGMLIWIGALFGMALAPFSEHIISGCLFVLVPFYLVYYVITRWEEMKDLFFLYLLGSAMWVVGLGYIGFILDFDLPNGAARIDLSKGGARGDPTTDFESFQNSIEVRAMSQNAGYYGSLPMVFNQKVRWKGKFEGIQPIPGSENFLLLFSGLELPEPFELRFSCTAEEMPGFPEGEQVEFEATLCDSDELIAGYGGPPAYGGTPNPHYHRLEFNKLEAVKLKPDGGFSINGRVKDPTAPGRYAELTSVMIYAEDIRAVKPADQQ